MAEALALIGLVSNVVGFIQIGVELVSVAQSFGDARKIPDISELDSIVDDIQLRHAGLRQQMKSSDLELSKADLNILSMVGQCDKIADQLRSLSKDLSKKPGVRSRAADTVRKAAKYMWNRKTVSELGERLIRMDNMIREYTRTALQSEQHSVITQKLDSVSRLYKEFDIKYDMKLDEIRDDVVEAIEKVAARTEMELSAHGAQLANLQEILVKLKKELNTCDERATFIRSLYFKEIRRRWSLIPDAEWKTNAWLFDRTQTTFASWAESENVSAIYCISGWAGSGKSTLMKFAYDHPDTRKLLQKWAYPFKLYTASYFFWNQGFERQKSQAGLLQSLLYQILRHNPDLASVAKTGRLHHELWDFQELKSVFEQVISKTEMKTRFCFFVDGLDEYNGEDEDISGLLLSINKSPHIKICASSRPRTVFDDTLWSDGFGLKMQDMTKDDMKVYVRNTFHGSPRFEQLPGSRDLAEELTEQIAKGARGVWLWVFLISRDLKHAANRGEGPDKLKEIVDSFPADLEEYFARIISDVKPAFRDEMARIFLASLEGVQPLPLLAFTLVVKELSDPDYAMKATTSSLDPRDVRKIEKNWKERLYNRCGDLFVVEDGPHPNFLDCPVDFLHRTVRDFLQDCYLENLKAELKSSFNPSLSLCRVMLYFLKKHPERAGFRAKDKKSINSIINVVDQVLYYAREAERYAGIANSTLNAILDEVDEVVSAIHPQSPRGTLSRLINTENHWTCARDSPRARGLDKYDEGGNCNYLALTVQARIVTYVRAKLAANPGRLRKPGRPLLDYALRPYRITPLATPYHAQRDEPNISVETVELLLEAGADPNQMVFLNDDRSVWALFLISCAESTARKEFNEASKEAWKRASELMIEHGARSKCFSPADPAGLRDLGQVLRSIFRDDEADELMRKVRGKEAERFSKSWPGRLYNLSFWA